MNKTIVLLTPLTGAQLERLVAIFSDDARVVVAQSTADLMAIDFDSETTLLSFGSGVIVCDTILTGLSKPAYNLHAASPQFPGRDPHHHAIYRGAENYGVTLHIMTDKVDAGSIVAVKTFPIGRGDTPASILARANEAGMALLERLGTRLLEAEQLPQLEGVSWGTRKTSRTDLLHLCNITPLIGEDDFTRRCQAFDNPDYDNLALRLHGQTFRIDKATPFVEIDNAAFSEFTESAYRKLLQQLKSEKYRFAFYGDKGDDRHVIWRHDIDISVHRAARLAQIEADEGVVATYFVNPHCEFYNVMEPKIGEFLHTIRELGHDIGLHLDADAYPTAHWTRQALEQAIEREKILLKTILGYEIYAMSWHNPDLSNLLDFDEDEICGLVNAYSARLKRDYVYCSDSNGYWRYQPMDEVIRQGHKRLHLLTHPAWWTPEPLAPSDRIDRALMGRARKIRHAYDELLKKGNRKNVSK